MKERKGKEGQGKGTRFYTGTSFPTLPAGPGPITVHLDQHSWLQSDV